MKAEELMIGDWVKMFNVAYIVSAINKNGVRFEQQNGFSGGAYDAIEPIPLTPEILEKNGMHLYNRKTNRLMEECNHSDCFIEDEDNRVELSLDNNGKIRWSINSDEYTIIPLDYVHQLQHALRLCSINKQIEL